MIPICDRLHLFFDAELSAEEAEEIRVHLADCPRCQQELHEVMQLDDVMGRFAPPPLHLPRASPLSGRRLWYVVAALAAVSAASAAFLTWCGGTQGKVVVVAVAATRVIEGRLSYAGADRYRPYDVARGGPAEVERVPAKMMAALEEAGNRRGLVAGNVLQGNRKMAETLLDRDSPTPDDDSDRALLALLDGQPRRALVLADRALAVTPRHPQALWNRALALRDLGLWLVAAQAFDDVARLGERGWTREALQRSFDLRLAVSVGAARYAQVQAHGVHMAQTGEPLPVADIRDQPGLARRLFYDAVRAAPSPQRVEALRPVAEELDRIFGGRHLAQLIDQTAAADFSRREPLAAAYARRVAGEKLAPAALAVYAGAAFRAGQGDIAIGAVLPVETDPMPARFVPEYVAFAKASADPWLRFLGIEQDARARIDGSKWVDAADELLDGLEACGKEKLAYRCALLRFHLGRLYHATYRMAEAGKRFDEVWDYARRSNEWKLGLTAINWLAESAAMGEDEDRAPVVLARAYLEERLARDFGNCAVEAYVHRTLAMLLLNRSQRADARRELDQALAARQRCGDSKPNLRLATVGSQLASPGRETDQWRREIAELRREASDDPGQVAYLDHIEGRLMARTDAAAGEALLRRAIAGASEHPESEAARRARSYSYAVLVMEATRASQPERILQLVAEELGVAPPPRCVVAVAAAEGSAVVARGADGVLHASLEPVSADADFDTSRLVPADIRAALAGCEVVDVLALPPVRGRPDLLPPEIAWRYGVPRGTASAAQQRAHRVVVADVAVPQFLRLPPLPPFGGQPMPSVFLSGTGATLERFFAETRNATEIEIHAHGIAGSDEDTSYIPLAPGPDGAFELTAARIREHPLRGSPLVILAACRAGATPNYSHDTWTLPSAFLRAGASAVLASPEPIPDGQATRFFDAVRTRIAGGAAPAVALRDERTKWRKAGGGDWVSRVLVFE